MLEIGFLLYLMAVVILFNKTKTWLNFGLGMISIALVFIVAFNIFYLMQV